MNVPDLTAALTAQERKKLRAAWQDAPAVWRFVPNRGCPNFTRDWLLQQSPAEWHEIALHFNIENTDLSPLLTIARQANADRASIMSMVLSLDLISIEDRRKRKPSFNPAVSLPAVAELMDVIEAGFAAGCYARARFRISHDQAAMKRTKSYLASLSDGPYWALPDRAWHPVEGHFHQPEFMWDHVGNCQRLPFEDWVQLKLRPH